MSTNPEQTADITDSTADTTIDLLFRCLQRNWTPATVAEMAALPGTAWMALANEAERQRVAALLYYRVGQHQQAEQIPAEIRVELVQTHQETAVRNLVLYHHLDHLIRALEAQAIPVILLKGAYLAATVYEDIALRHMVDADLLVPEHALGTAIEIVTALGYRPLTPLMPVQSYLAHLHHLPRFFKEGSLSLEIHWTITRPNQVYTIPMTDLWARAQRTTVAGSEVATLAPEDLLLHVCLHATYQHLLEQGVRFLCDIDAICHHFGPTLDWAQVVVRAQAWKWARGVYLALHLAHELLAAPIPDDVLTALRADVDSTLLPSGLKSALFSQQMNETRPYSRIFAEMWHAPRVQDKVRTVWQRVFLPRDLLVMKHGVAAHSPKLLWYYLLRVVDLLWRYGGVVSLSRRQQIAIDARLKRKAQLVDWLENQSTEV